MWHGSTHTVCVTNWCVFKPIRMSIVLLVTCTCIDVLCVYTEKISSMLQSHASVVYEKTSVIKGVLYMHLILQLYLTVTFLWLVSS